MRWCREIPKEFLVLFEYIVTHSKFENNSSNSVRTLDSRATFVTENDEGKLQNFLPHARCVIILGQ